MQLRRAGRRSKRGHREASHGLLLETVAVPLETVGERVGIFFLSVKEKINPVFRWHTAEWVSLPSRFLRRVGGSLIALWGRWVLPHRRGHCVNTTV
jgi:hypothetical protein